VRDAEGQKMSKSKGNVIDPIDVIDGIGLPELLAKRTSGLMQPHLAASIERATRKQYPQGIAAHGTDALRFTFASLATQSRDLRFDLSRVEGSRHFCNKLWNAARFALRSFEDSGAAAASSAEDSTGIHAQLGNVPALDPASTDVLPPATTASVADRWIRSRLGAALAALDEAIEDYRFDFAASVLYEFTWGELCDWYLEIVKPALAAGDANGASLSAREAARAARTTLVTVLETLLRALHPLMPFITEEIWLRLAPRAGVSGETIMLAPWPRAADFPRDAAAEAEIGWVRSVVQGIRQIRSEMEINPSRRVPLLLQHPGPLDRARQQRHGALVAHLAGLGEVRELRAADAPPPAAAAMVGELALLVPMAGLIEPASELARLDRLLQKNTQDLSRARGRLANDEFIRHAPSEIVAQERTRLADFERTRNGLERQLAQVRALAAQNAPEQHP
jgi:valyl-tRNA synthetase